MDGQMELVFPGRHSFVEGVQSFRGMGSTTLYAELEGPGGNPVSFLTNEFWTSKQRAAHSLHEVSYRACFKPQLPRFFIERLTREGDWVYDPFMGRGTTLLEAALMGRKVMGCDINPLSRLLVEPRLSPPLQEEVEARLRELDLNYKGDLREDLLVFYHPDTLREIHGLRRLWMEPAGLESPVDGWIRMVATNRLTGHSPGFFSVYSLPPNQAVTVERQRLINEKRKQVPPYRDVRSIIAKKSRQLLQDLTSGERERLRVAASDACLSASSCVDAVGIPRSSAVLAVTSPPFLKVVDYVTDNWLRCWFNGIDPESIGIWQLGKLSRWAAAMESALIKTREILVPGGYFAFEVGEVDKGTVKLERTIVEVAANAGYEVLCVMVNQQEFTKTSNCWGVDNASKGTNTNRIVVLRSPE
ncbi:MAG TPA: DNA methyltransferase [Opitutales bacterium]|nr:DNA methyltransferase [Opitutales bacterium]